MLSFNYIIGSENEDGNRQNFLLIPTTAISEKIVKEILTRCGESLERRKNKEVDTPHIQFGLYG